MAYKSVTLRRKTERERQRRYRARRKGPAVSPSLVLDELEPFQEQFLAGAMGPGIDTAVLSLPRGNGKSTLAGHLVARALTPGDSLWIGGGQEVVLMAASVEQARHVFGAVKGALEKTGRYRWIDSVVRLGAFGPDGCRLRVVSSNHKTALGLVRTPLVVADEPGAWETSGGRQMADAIFTSQGKPGSSLRALFLGTIAPARSGWWPELVAGGSGPGRYVQALQGTAKRWDDWDEVLRVNPLSKYPELRSKLDRELTEAKQDDRLKARFLSFRLNLPTADESEVLLTIADWERVRTRPVPDRAGKPLVGFDLGGGRAWSAASAIWQSGRVEALALAPGIPGIADQERRDKVPAGTYSRLVKAGSLRIAEGRRVPEVSHLVDLVRQTWGVPENVYCDRFRLGELQDAIGTVAPIIPRTMRWSEAAEDIRALRQIAADGPLSVAPESRDLVATSLAVSVVVNDDAGNVRLVKGRTGNESRDDVAAALVLVGGGYVRSIRKLS